MEGRGNETTEGFILGISCTTVFGQSTRSLSWSGSNLQEIVQGAQGHQSSRTTSLKACIKQSSAHPGSWSRGLRPYISPFSLTFLRCFGLVEQWLGIGPLCFLQSAGSEDFIPASVFAYLSQPRDVTVVPSRA
jgi:hypothetical protein